MRERVLLSHLALAGEALGSVSHSGQADFSGRFAPAERHMAVVGGEAVWVDGKVPDPLGELDRDGEASEQLRKHLGAGGRRML